MITEKQIEEIRNFLKKAENPLFFFDDDPDGFAAALVLYKMHHKGIIVPIKAPMAEVNLFVNGVKKYNPDLVVILDRAVVSQEVFDNIHVPVVWLDHHEPVERFRVHYYNPTLLDKDDNKCTSYLAYLVADEWEWIAAIGIIGDWQLPSFMKTFKYKRLFNNQKTPPSLLFDSDFGKLIRIFSFALKGETKEVRKAIDAAQKVNTPQEVLQQESEAGKWLYRKYEKVNKGYLKLLEKARALEPKAKKEPLVFVYTDAETSFTSELSNELLHRTKSEVIIVAREKGDEYRISIRGRTIPIRPIVKKALVKVHGYGGGHPLACGATVHKHDFETFISVFREELSN